MGSTLFLTQSHVDELAERLRELKSRDWARMIQMNTDRNGVYRISMSVRRCPAIIREYIHKDRLMIDSIRPDQMFDDYVYLEFHIPGSVRGGARESVV